MCCRSCQDAIFIRKENLDRAKKSTRFLHNLKKIRMDGGGEREREGTGRGGEGGEVIGGVVGAGKFNTKNGPRFLRGLPSLLVLLMFL